MLGFVLYLICLLIMTGFCTHVLIILGVNRATATSSPGDAVSNGGDDNVTNNPNTANPSPNHTTGLANLGNTCFMNATLQCCAHIPLLREYFLSGRYEDDLNVGNSLGTGGEMAKEFAGLLGEMWQIKHRSVDRESSNCSRLSSVVTNPRSFLAALVKHHSLFFGGNQHDSEELGISLLDSLHEDTNRVRKKKTYIETPNQAENESDDEAARRMWKAHLQNNDSALQDIFMGQIKSHIECPHGCNHVKYDPFSNLDLPVPSIDRTLKVTFVLKKAPELGNAVPSLCRRATVLTIRLDQKATVEMMQQAVTNLVRECYGLDESTLPNENLLLAKVVESKIESFYTNGNQPIFDIDGDDVVHAYLVEECTLGNDWLVSRGRFLLEQQEKKRKEAAATGPVNKVVSIEDCIAKYCEAEQMDEHYYCGICNKGVLPVKQLSFHRTPAVLNINLKRYHYSSDSQTGGKCKIDTKVDFPLEGLDLRGIVNVNDDEAEPIYDCFAVSNHFGGLGGGHYTAHARGEDGEWCEFDDSRVTTGVDKSVVASKAVYSMFYVRRDIHHVMEKLAPRKETVDDDIEDSSSSNDTKPSSNSEDSDDESSEKSRGDDSDSASSDSDSSNSDSSDSDSDDDSDHDGDYGTSGRTQHQGGSKGGRLCRNSMPHRGEEDSDDDSLFDDFEERKIKPDFSDDGSKVDTDEAEPTKAKVCFCSVGIMHHRITCSLIPSSL